MDGGEIVRIALAAVIPVLVGALSALFASLFTTARRLRKDLATDAELMSKMPESRARDDLADDVARRVRVLMAATTHRTFTPVRALEALAIIVLLAGGAAFAVLAIWTAEDNLEPSAALRLAFTIGVSAFGGLVIALGIESEVLRILADRSRYLRGNVEPKAAREFRDEVSVPLALCRSLIMLIVAWDAFAISALVAWETGYDWWYAVVFFGITGIGFMVVFDYVAITPGRKRWKGEKRALWSGAEVETEKATQPPEQEPSATPATPAAPSPLPTTEAPSEP